MMLRLVQTGNVLGGSQELFEVQDLTRSLGWLPLNQLTSVSQSSASASSPSLH